MHFWEHWKISVSILQGITNLQMLYMMYADFSPGWYMATWKNQDFILKVYLIYTGYKKYKEHFKH